MMNAMKQLTWKMKIYRCLFVKEVATNDSIQQPAMFWCNSAVITMYEPKIFQEDISLRGKESWT